MRFYPIAGSVVAFTLCYLSIIPGATDGWFLELFGLFSGLLVCWMIWLAVRIVDRRNGPRPPHNRWLTRSLWVVCLTGFALYWTGAARWAAFESQRGALERMIVEKPDTTFEGIVCGKTFGEFKVIRYIADERGGVYFLTTIQQVGFGPGPEPATYCGFVRGPNPTGTPWGDRRYKLSHVSGDWFEFSASETRNDRNRRD